MPSLNTKLASAPNTTSNYVLKATSSTTIGNSLIQDNGTTITLGGALSGTSATFSGEIKSGDTITLGAAAVGGFWTWGSTISYLVAGTGKALNLNPNGATGTTGLSIATTGAATFSSSVTAASGLYNGYTSGLPPTSGSATRGGLRLNNASNIALDFGTVAAGQAWLQVSDANNYASNFALLLNPNGGNVGIGTSSPSRKLVVNSGIDGISAGIVGSTYGIRFDNGGTFSSGMSTIHGVDSTLTGSYQPLRINGSDLRFATSDIERMRITGGDLLIGTTTSVGQKFRIYQSSTAQWNIKLIQPNGSDQLFQEFLTTTDNDATNTARGSIRYNGTNVLYLGTSDYRLKEDLKDYNALDIVSQLKTYDFKWKEAGTRDYGMMAHELQEVLPNYVTGVKDELNEDGSINPQQVDYSKLIPVLVKSIQELNAKVTQQQQQINQLINK